MKHSSQPPRAPMGSSVTPRTPGDVGRLPDRYSLRELAGKGGMGVVYQAVDLRTGKRVAIKVLHSRGVIEMARFEQEARVLAELSHPGIVRYSDHGTTPEGCPYIAMEWLEGETLEDRLARGRLDPSEAVSVARLVLLALSAAHGRDIVHRDIKPGNIFLVGGSASDLRVLDFGIARRRFDIKRFTRDGSTVGTPLYTSPEQARGRGDVDGRADIFSLGCVLFEALAGEPPFSGDSPLEVMTKVCAGETPELSVKNPSLPPALVALVRLMLAPDPARRPQSAAQLAAEFERLDFKSLARQHDAGARPAAAKRGRAGGQERLACVMRILHGRRQRQEDERVLAEVRRLAAQSGCTLDRLIDRSLLVTVGAGEADAQADRLAALALALRQFEPTVRIAIASGRTAVVGNLPVGPLMERLPLLMAGQEPGSIRVDEATRRMLATGYHVEGTPAPLLLRAITEPVAAMAPLADDVATPSPAGSTSAGVARPRRTSVTDS
jgi:tRNA A-37 threonylcarbamoyl transferase component Bud32